MMKKSVSRGLEKWMARLYLIPERKEMKGGRSGVSLRAANWSEDGGAPRRGPAFIPSKRKRSVISNRLATELLFNITEFSVRSNR